MKFIALQVGRLSAAIGEVRGSSRQIHARRWVMDHDQRLTESLISAIGTGDIGLVENLIRRHGADVNAGFPARRLRVGEQAMIAGTRPIQFAARRKDVTATRLLLNSGADPGLPDRWALLSIAHGLREVLLLLYQGRKTEMPIYVKSSAVCCVRYNWI